MAGDVVIRAEGLGKKYVIGHQSSERYTALRDVLARTARNFARDAGEMLRGKPIYGGDDLEEFWALKDISFDIKRGDVVGIIGRNGAGKSTLLKVLSRITEPTEGRVEIRGRVASLLEVGTGFHPELTGRENIYLNGAILGMSQSDVRRKFDEIVEFAGMDRFLDTPVKRYSSGMYVRLAFSVAAHLDPEILIVDEVLAVGDTEFQAKCLGKMESVSRGGRTVLFVSHNLGVISKICPLGILMDKGQVKEFGPSNKLIARYIEEGLGARAGMSREYTEDISKPFQILSARTVASDGVPRHSFSCDDSVGVECICAVRETVPGLYGYMDVSRVDGTTVLVSDSFDAQDNPLERARLGRQRLLITIPSRTLGPGEYLVTLNFTSHSNKTGFNVDSPGAVARFVLDDYTTRRGNNRRGYLSAILPWSLNAE